jgi:uncharacterized membrane protein YcgQ (UPF0703/DUF1980 family)
MKQRPSGLLILAKVEKGYQGRKWLKVSGYESKAKNTPTKKCILCCHAGQPKMTAKPLGID